LLRARPIAARASTVKDMRVAYDKEGIDPCKCATHCCECVPVTSFRTGINDDEYGLHHDYEVWLERLAPHAPVDQAGPEAGCTTGPARTPVLNEVTGTRTRT
jgi:hypothetical protein